MHSLLYACIMHISISVGDAPFTHFNVLKNSYFHNSNSMSCKNVQKPTVGMEKQTTTTFIFLYEYSILIRRYQTLALNSALTKIQPISKCSQNLALAKI